MSRVSSGMPDALDPALSPSVIITELLRACCALVWQASERWLPGCRDKPNFDSRIRLAATYTAASSSVMLVACPACSAVTCPAGRATSARRQHSFTAPTPPGREPRLYLRAGNRETATDEVAFPPPVVNCINVHELI